MPFVWRLYNVYAVYLISYKQKFVNSSFCLGVYIIIYSCQLKQ